LLSEFFNPNGAVVSGVTAASATLSFAGDYLGGRSAPESAARAFGGAAGAPAGLAAQCCGLVPNPYLKAACTGAAAAFGLGGALKGAEIGSDAYEFSK